MVADIARTTYDPGRQYRALIAQQGRVTLEADNNEASSIAVESLRLETIDILGPAGTPNDGYKVGTSGNTITIGAGTYYLSGWRLTLNTPVDVAHQPDWIDTDPVVLQQGNELIALLVTEQSVCAVEDQALREVALGGPDSAARTRLMQHFLTIPIDGDNCATGATTISGLLDEDGVTIDPATCALVSQARLLAGFVPGPPDNDPCTPAAAGGYLGADNQMIRVTVIAYDAPTRSGTLLWGWNNASLLYRANMTDPVTLTLVSVPVDEEHAPQLGQMVEILRTEAELGDGNRIADSEGFVTSLAQAYSFDTGEIVLSDPLPAEFQSDKNMLFVRLWQAAVPFDAGKATPLDDSSGVTVAITLPVLPTHIAGRPFWHFAVRPATPQNIYPQRYFDAPQPPDGPRQWITDLAVVQSTGKSVTVIDDCRVQFPGNGGGTCSCCGLVLGPDDVASRGGLQSVVASLAGGPAVLSLKAGVYILERPLLLNDSNSGLIIEGCSDGVIIEGNAKNLAAFGTGLVRLNGATDVTLRRLTFNGQVAAPTNKQSGLVPMAAVTLVAVEDILIEDCTFKLLPRAVAVFGGAIMVLGATESVRLRRNRFLGEARDSILCGVFALTTAKNVSTALDGWEIADNSFQGFYAAVVGFAHLGLIRCLDNVVTNCGSGFVFAQANIGAASAFLTAATAAQNAQLSGAATALMRRDILAKIITQGALFDSLSKVAPPSVSEQAMAVLSADMQTRGNDALAALTDAKAASGTAAKKRTTKAAHETSATAETSAAGTSGAPDPLEGASIVAEAYEPQLVPALRITDNEISLGTVSTWIGIAMIQSPSDAMTTLVVTGNRVSVPDVNSIACGILFPSAASISGNMFLQLGGFEKSAKAALIAISQTGILQIGANVVRFEEFILPARTPPATTSWDFLNTVAS
jgi:hypothetical protein